MTSSWDIKPLNTTNTTVITGNINQKTKPLGALGDLEILATQIALIQQTPKININPVMVVFAADHGIADEGVSIAPSIVTQQMVLNFLQGGAAINCFCRTQNLPLFVVDAGIKYPIEPYPKDLISQRIGSGTNNFAHTSAMSIADAERALDLGTNLANDFIQRGFNTLAFGEMGIGNSSSAAALLAAITGEPVEHCCGRGTGISDEQLMKKIQLITQGLKRISSKAPLYLLSEVGGFEIAQICGAMLATAQAGKTIVVDGFIASTAALVAIEINPAARDYMIFAHKSHEQGHQILLKKLNAKPLLDLGLRLGEGTGAALALPLLKAAESFYNDMATFASTGITVDA
ncbi:nicotinate-nucleotide--dimethylbenzimidazole phosphoribosyltransferase [Cellvibrio zantedeschiae]|uniref:Nicotinate-nucleotide--dimethylbenzimidazole phosphoribosyltransferase n=1 Tax=Cellvibrio zantedeschiae TaxID=1237077 RepID=A0ABQ3B5B0_9GAMM|nr:nicotinate-nucleotide--dimethylbenzimidazole phosphoribosyltransferase [Cellvibrio zantedeschiae]GGY74547.1 nicotinate-nucleotide--dimethylbenzimidazole phosphoribosyltransferase [Cellvibrio zantedeschiae]